MHSLRYQRPARIEDALKMFGDDSDAAYVSGGHTLLPTMKQGLARPTTLVDLTAIPALRHIDLDHGHISIGAATCHADVAASAIVRENIPALAGLAGSIGDRHVRNRGTIGGSVANNDPAADYPAAVLGLGATVVTDRREIPADDFFVALYETALEPGEIITQISFPIAQIAGYAKFRSAASRYSVAAVFISRGPQGVRVAVTGAGARGVFRAHDMEKALAEDFRAEALAHVRIDPATLLDDLNGTPDYRAHLVQVMARRAMENLGSAQSYK
ncbi:MAG TPA: xanthine dehydrogenase family protein subunit M [Pseudolabrys sp.]|jgi:carbon-monoxide dehydrogenase medium subunit|nr:xanthine dehydrogenase family protein subunit M [Pseudolabrys sp.]